MTLEDALDHASKQCNHGVEEEGGIILVNKEDNDYEFIKLRNVNEGTFSAPHLWTADQNEYAEKILPKVMSKTWKHFASFHTHPRFTALPSGIDLGILFPGFSKNYIYSPVHGEITEWTYDYYTKRAGIVRTFIWVDHIFEVAKLPVAVDRLLGTIDFKS